MRGGATCAYIVHVCVRSRAPRGFPFPPPTLGIRAASSVTGDVPAPGMTPGAIPAPAAGREPFATRKARADIILASSVISPDRRGYPRRRVKKKLTK